MFDMFPNFWTPILPVAEIGASPVAVELAGEPLVLFRDSADKIGVLVDRCPHRGAALSLGRITEDGGCIECPYHGWQFDATGACHRVPLNKLDQAQLFKLSAVSLPSRTIAGLVWVFTGLLDVPEPQFPSTLSEAELGYAVYHEVWNAHWTRVLENTLDPAHVPFVHRNSFGQFMNKAAQADAVLEFELIPTNYGSRNFAKGGNGSSGIEVEWYKPNCTVLTFDKIGMPYRGHIFAVPLNQEQTRLFLVRSPAGGMDKQIYDFEFSRKELAEDRRVVESQVGEVPIGSEEHHVPTDKTTLWFRHWYHREMKSDR